MKLAEKHSIEFDEVSVNNRVVTVKARNCNERVSGKMIYDNATGGFFTADNHHTAVELAKRNAARQLLPLPEIKAVEKKVQLESDFDWKKAQAACLKLVPAHNLSVLIYDLTQAGKLREDNPSHYNRTEWLMIYDYCQKDAKVQVELDPEGKSLNRWSYNSVVFLEECQKRLDAMRAEKLRKPVEQLFGRSNDTTKRLSKLYDENPLEFEVDTTKPNMVKLIYSNGTVATVYDQVIYESVLRA